MSATLTVVVVFEFSFGKVTLGKGFNLALETFLAGALGFGAHHLETLVGDKGHHVILWFFTFPSSTIRLWGIDVYTNTFCLVSVSGYQEDEILKLAHKRVSTIALGCLTYVIMSIFVFPVWAGRDLHKLISHNIEKQSYFLQGFGELYFRTKGDTDMSWLYVYISVLNSMTAEEEMVWPPWKQYLKISARTQQSAYMLEALSIIITSEIKVCKYFSYYYFQMHHSFHDSSSRPHRLILKL
ncbi:hypothetical protein MKX03_019999 [Papaver bracteatum]|nr:hypothetical protein MKX03_019999 [Papaver bracteatum]